MESGINVRQFDRFFKLVSSVVTLVTNGKRSITHVCDALQKIVSEKGYELYLAPGQKNGGWVKGFDLEKYLQEEKLIERAFSLEDELVKGWLANPATYPEEFGKKAIFLWKSTRTTGSDRGVAYLYWSGGRVVVRWRWLEGDWDGDNPALLASS